ncbi:BA75_03209T0 [Komagataella pastoris]|uniref:BA75_03209T0 n=1 Tax=Komagataella pastoris TaxID=4922 RepID=A0A1B2JCZ7_PICPA|nr:BA75_03209T0 [Komagataella pastoris]
MDHSGSSGKHIFSTIHDPDLPPFKSSLIKQDDSIPGIRTLRLQSVIVLFLSRMVGSGIFATPGGILADCQGSILLFMATWVIGGVIALSGTYVYLELGSYLPVNGATKIFLEFMFPYPLYFTSFIFGAFTILFNFSSTNALVFAEYIRYALGYSYQESAIRYLAITAIIAVVCAHGYSRKVGLAVQNFIGLVKIIQISMLFLTCIYVFFFPESLTGIENHLHMKDFFSLPSTFSSVSYATATLKAIHSFGGWTSAFAVQNEIKKPIETLRLAATISLVSIIALYLTMNLAYLKVVPHKDIQFGGQLVGALFFTKLFGPYYGHVLFSLFIALASLGNLLVVVFVDSRLVVEVAREGLVPFSSILRSNRPFRTPLAALITHGILSSLVIIIPRNRVYSYIISLQFYPNQVFHALVCLGLLFRIRRKFHNVLAPTRAPTFVVYICFLGSLSVVLSPFIPSSKNSFKDASFAFIGVGALLLFSFCWFLLYYWWPQRGKFSVEREWKKDSFDGMTYYDCYKTPQNDELNDYGSITIETRRSLGGANY